MIGEFEMRKNKQDHVRKYEKPKRTDLLSVNFKWRILESKSKSEALVTGNKIAKQYNQSKEVNILLPASLARF